MECGCFCVDQSDLISYSLSKKLLLQLLPVAIIATRSGKPGVHQSLAAADLQVVAVRFASFRFPRNSILKRVFILPFQAKGR
jgi:hypothetical protein